MSLTALRQRMILCASILVFSVLGASHAGASGSMLRPWSRQAATPELGLTDLNGRQWNLEQLRGKVVVLNFWASWCAPCVEELPVLNELAGGEAGRDKPVVLGVNFKESATVIERFTQEHSFRYPILQDKSGEVVKKWAGSVMPTTVLIDRHGKARWRIVGALERNDPEFKRVLQQLLDEAGDGAKARLQAASFHESN